MRPFSNAVRTVVAATVFASIHSPVSASEVTIGNDHVAFLFEENAFGLSLTRVKKPNNSNGLKPQMVLQDAPDQTYAIEAGPLFEVEMFDPLQPCDSQIIEVTLDTTTFSFAHSRARVGQSRILTMVWTGILVPGYAGNTLDVTVDFELDDDASVGSFSIEVNAATPDLALFSITAPVVGIRRWADPTADWLVTSWAGGLAIRDPHQSAQLFPQGYSFGVPGFVAAQFWTFYQGNEDVDRALYYSNEDTEGYIKRLNIKASPDGKHSRCMFQHFPEDHIVAGARSYTLPYQPVLGLVDGNGGWYGATDYYRNWLESTATLPAKSFDRVGLSPQIIDSGFFGTFSVEPTQQTGIGDFTAIIDRVNEWRTYFDDCAGLPDCDPGFTPFGSSDVSVMVRDSHGNKPSLETGWFAWFPYSDSSVQQMLLDAPAENIYPAMYYNPNDYSPHIDPGNLSLAAFASVDECGNVRMEQDEDGDPITMDIVLDDSSIGASAFWIDEVLNKLQPDGWRGSFWDEYTQKDSRNEYNGLDGKPLGGGNAVSANIGQIVGDMRSQARVSDPGYFFITEHLKAECLDVTDLVFQNIPGVLFADISGLDLGFYIVPVNTVVFHEYVPKAVTTATVPVVEPIDAPIIRYLWAYYYGLEGFHPAVTNDDCDDTSTHPITPGSLTEETYLFLKKMVRFYHFSEDYFKFGRRMKDLPLDGIETVPHGTLDEVEPRYLFPQYDLDVYPTVFSPVWKAQDGTIGIPIINWTGPDQAVSLQQNFSFEFDAVRDFNMPLQASYQLFEEKETGRQLLATFSNTTTISFSSSIAQTHVRMLILE